ncbi:MAG: hypothetical protein Q7T55_07810 [Solirubrobacteraceae bacterium]|nr:hypothetical protein [Solirubrobacteraceae bacterium]
MSHKSRTLIRGLALAGVSSVAIAGAAAPAQAASKTLNYSCTYPYVDVQPLSAAIEAAIPDTIASGTASPAYDISAVATAGGDTSVAVATIGAKTIEGVTNAKSTVNATGQTVPLDVPITVPQQAVAPSGDLIINAAGSTPSITLTSPGPATITVDSIALNLTARNSSGTAITLPPVVAQDSDGDPSTFDVPCTTDAGQDTTLASVNVT